jgi:hypothetical protein
LTSARRLNLQVLPGPTTSFIGAARAAAIDEQIDDQGQRPIAETTLPNPNPGGDVTLLKADALDLPLVRLETVIGPGDGTTRAG